MKSSNIGYSEILDWLKEHEGVMIYMPEGIKASAKYENNYLVQVIVQGGRDVVFEGLPQTIKAENLTVAGVVTNGGLFVTTDIISPDPFSIIQEEDEGIRYNLQWQIECFEYLKHLKFRVAEYDIVVAADSTTSAEWTHQRNNIIEAARRINPVLASLEYPIRSLRIVYNDRIYAEKNKDRGRRIMVEV